MTRTVHLALVPRDGLFCKDGRGWHTSASGRGHALDWPWPSTVLGALRTGWGRGEEARQGVRFRPDEWRTRTAAIRLGRTLVLRRGHGEPWIPEHTVWPVPADARWMEGRPQVHRLEPVRPDVPTLGRDDDEAREGLMRPAFDGFEKPLPPPRWWNREDFSNWLAGRPVPVRGGEAALVTVRRIQVHVGIHPEKLTAEEGILFSHDVVETLELGAEWAIGAEVSLPDSAGSDVATLGSDSKLARIEQIPADLFEPPAELLEAFGTPSQGLRVVAVTPLCFERGWLPDGLDRDGGVYRGRLPGIADDVILRAAFVPRPVHVSGWDMAANNGRGTPKPTSRMVPPGAVYFFERVDGRPFDEADARALWLAPLGQRTDEGFGRVAPGIWRPTHARSDS